MELMECFSKYYFFGGPAQLLIQGIRMQFEDLNFMVGDGVTTYFIKVGTKESDSNDLEKNEKRITLRCYTKKEWKILKCHSLNL